MARLLALLRLLLQQHRHRLRFMIELFTRVYALIIVTSALSKLMHTVDLTPVLDWRRSAAASSR